MHRCPRDLHLGFILQVTHLESPSKEGAKLCVNSLAHLVGLFHTLFLVISALDEQKTQKRFQLVGRTAVLMLTLDNINKGTPAATLE